MRNWWPLGRAAECLAAHVMIRGHGGGTLCLAYCMRPAQGNTHTPIYVHTHTYICTHTHLYMYTHTPIYVHTHTYICIHTQTTHKTHTHIQILDFNENFILSFLKLTLPPDGRGGRGCIICILFLSQTGCYISIIKWLSTEFLTNIHKCHMNCLCTIVVFACRDLQIFC